MEQGHPLARIKAGRRGELQHRKAEGGERPRLDQAKSEALDPGEGVGTVAQHHDLARLEPAPSLATEAGVVGRSVAAGGGRRNAGSLAPLGCRCCSPSHCPGRCHCRSRSHSRSLGRCRCRCRSRYHCLGYCRFRRHCRFRRRCRFHSHGRLQRQGPARPGDNGNRSSRGRHRQRPSRGRARRRRPEGYAVPRGAGAQEGEGGFVRASLSTMDLSSYGPLG